MIRSRNENTRRKFAYATPRSLPPTRAPALAAPTSLPPARPPSPLLRRFRPRTPHARSYVAPTDAPALAAPMPLPSTHAPRRSYVAPTHAPVPGRPFYVALVRTRASHAWRPLDIQARIRADST
ncbi:hypothetical protein GCM10009744_24500 [Kribbella alba]|uniref:Uncharacterized protein n=1 Tax=Kribbella alba TaxID=190197 RepID=A0ABN2F834_9ACTN